MNKKKVLIFQPFLSTYRYDLYNELSGRFQIKVLLWYYHVAKNTVAFDVEKINRKAKFDFKYLKCLFSISPKINQLGLVKYLFKYKPDILMPHEFGPNTFIALLFKSILKYKICVTCDDSPEMAQKCKGFKSIIRKFVLSHVDIVVLVNPTVVKIFKDRYPNKSCRYFYFPIIQKENVFKEKLTDSLEQTEKYIERYDLKDKKVVLFVGRLVPVKGIDLLISAFREISKVMDDVRLVVVGDGVLLNELKADVAKLKLQELVFFTGQLSDNELYAWFNVGQILVLPSRFEPFGAVVNEALIAGCHVVVSNQVGAQCLIENSNGHVFDIINTSELTSCLQKSIDGLKPLKSAIVKENQMKTSFSYYFTDFEHQLLDVNNH